MSIRVAKAAPFVGREWNGSDAILRKQIGLNRFRRPGWRLILFIRAGGSFRKGRHSLLQSSSHDAANSPRALSDGAEALVFLGVFAFGFRNSLFDRFWPLAIQTSNPPVGRGLPVTMRGLDHCSSQRR